MDQINQLQNNLRQSRQNLNSMFGQINQQLENSERIIQNIVNQTSQQQNQFQYSPNPTYTQFGGQTGVLKSQYNPTQNTQYGTNLPHFPTTSSSQYAQNNNYPQPSMQKGGGVNQYGAQYSSGIKDDNIGQSYYQMNKGK